MNSVVLGNDKFIDRQNQNRRRSVGRCRLGIRKRSGLIIKLNKRPSARHANAQHNYDNLVLPLLLMT